MAKTWKDRRDAEQGYEAEELTDLGEIGPGLVQVTCHPHREQTVVEPHLLRPREQEA